MALVHLRLAEHAALSIIDAVRNYKLERTRKSGAPDAARLVHALRDAHLGLEKLIKAGLARQDEALLLEKSSLVALQGIRAEMLARGVTSMLELKQDIQTLSADAAWKACAVVYKSVLDQSLSESFGTALSRLGRLRNPARHAELHEDSEEILAAIERSLAKMRVVASSICPEVVALIEQRSSVTLDDIRGIEQNVDGSWLVIAEYLGGGDARTIAMDFEMYVQIDPSSNVASISIVREAGGRLEMMLRDAVEPRNNLYVATTLERREEMGLFGKLISAAEAVARRTQMESQLPPIPADFEPVGSAKPEEFPALGRESAIRTAFGIIGAGVIARRERQGKFIRAFGLPVLEGGAFALTNVLSNLSAVLPNGQKRKSKSTDVFFSGRFRIGEGERQGTIDGELRPFSREPQVQSQPIGVRGGFWLTGEIVVDVPEGHFPAGTVIRYFSGRLELSR